MSQLEKEIEIIKLQDRRKHLGMMNIAHLSYDEQVMARAQYRVDVQEIDRQIRGLQK